MQANYSNLSVEILVSGSARPIKEYHHKGQVFVEGRQGSYFELRLRNSNYFAIEAVISVDGLSITDGKPAGTNSQGYYIGALQTITIPGWLLNSTEVALFQFSGKGQSYAQQSGQTSTNCGVIGIKAFKPKVAPVTRTHYPYTPPIPWDVFNGINHGSNHWWQCDLDPVLNTHTVCGSLGTNDTQTIGQYMSRPLVSGASASSTVTGLSASITSTHPVERQTSGQSSSEPQNNLGTGFGKASDYKTTITAFQRGDLLVTMAIFYDDAKGLKARGIQLERPVVKVKQNPDPFPADNCAPPPGWTRT